MSTGGSRIVLEHDGWADAGNPGWSWQDVLPYFKRQECTALGSDDYRGRHGPVHVSCLADMPDPLSQAFHAACVSAGIPANDDYNGERSEGVGYLQLNTRRGSRCDSATAYLRGFALPNLVIASEALALRVLMEGRQAVGIEYEQGGRRHGVRAAREVIISEIGRAHV